ncbi:MAG: hypothetical protein MRJ65_02545 [Candidatus Brocadiaceae bacterium]|nr:hypothetical protein [Candidatus Brocadiaceae bacterium]
MSRLEQTIFRDLLSTSSERGRDTKETRRTRMFGVPTVTDRIAQMTIKLAFEPPV